MIDFVLKANENSVNLTFMKIVHKRSGIDAIEPGDTLYNIPLALAINYVAHKNAEEVIGERDVSLTTYISEYLKSHKEAEDKICGLSKKTL